MSGTATIKGRHIFLAPTVREHEPHYLRWFNDFPVQRTSGLLPMPWTKDSFRGWFDRRVMNKEDAAWFTVIESESGRPIGFCGVRDINHIHRTAEYFITIGEADCRGQGYGTEATVLTLDFAFMALNLHNIMLDVSSASLAGVRSYQKAGFREIGRRTECVPMGGRMYDSVYMECLSSEFQNSMHGSPGNEGNP